MINLKVTFWTICGWSAICTYGFIEGESSQYVPSDPLCKYQNDDYSSWTPPILTRGRVADLLNGEFFDEHLRDTPDHMRPPSVVAFYDSFDAECNKKYQALDFEDTAAFKLPSRAFLFAARYDMGAAPKRTWYKFVPERDLAKRFGVTECPSIVFVPPECDGFTKWCERETVDEVTYLGCDDYVDQCAGQYTIWAQKNGDTEYIDWINTMIEGARLPQIGGPKLTGPNKKQFTTMQGQEEWLKGRDGSTQRENYRNNWISSALPAFSEFGFKAVKMSREHREEFIRFYKKFRHLRAPENWNSHGQTAVNGHEVEPSMVSLDHDFTFRDSIVNKYIKPVLEEWVGFPLQLTSHYGIREYYDGSWLKNHVDRIDVLIISCTQSIAQIVCNTTADGFCDNSDDIDFVSGWPDDVKWPLEGVDWKGNNVRYEHAPGTMIMYESAKFIHGRPYPMPKHPNHPKQKYAHLGAFSHFTPADGSWKRLGHDRNARKNLNRNTKGTNFKTNPAYYPPKHYQNIKQEL